MKTEIWRVYPDDPRYEASSEGRIRRKKNKRIVAPFYGTGQKYDRISIYHGMHKKHTRVHEIVARTFIGERPEGMVVDHINSNLHDNRSCNLRYVTPQENQRNPYSIRNHKIGITRWRAARGYISIEEADRIIAEIMRESI